MKRPDKTKTVFILGAGASKHTGAPLMNEFLDCAHEIYLLGDAVGYDDDFRRVFEWQAKLKNAHSMCRAIDTKNIESVFSALEMADTLGCFSLLLGHDANVEDYIASMERVIAATLEKSMRFETSENARLAPSYDYSMMCRLLYLLNNKAFPKHDVGIISFNYDVALDYAIAQGHLQYSYCLDGVIPKQGISLLKLHGSLNWAQCVKCGKVLSADLTKPLLIPRSNNPYIALIDESLYCKKCRRNTKLARPLIVPPSWQKNSYYQKIRPVWTSAAKLLSEAENIFVIGFSLPETDSFFKYLYGLGTIGSSTIKRFWVFNPDENIKARFQDLVGPGAESRFNFEAIPMFAINKNWEITNSALKYIAEAIGFPDWIFSADPAFDPSRMFYLGNEWHEKWKYK